MSINYWLLYPLWINDKRFLDTFHSTVYKLLKHIMSENCQLCSITSGCFEAFKKFMSKEKFFVCAQNSSTGTLVLPNISIYAHTHTHTYTHIYLSKFIRFKSHKYVLQGFVIPAWCICLSGIMRKSDELCLYHFGLH